MSKKVSEKALAINAHLVQIRAYYPGLSFGQALCLASLNTIIDGYPGPLLGSDELLESVLKAISLRERLDAMPSPVVW